MINNRLLAISDDLSVGCGQFANAGVDINAIKGNLTAPGTFAKRVRVADDTKVARIEFGEIRNAKLSYQQIITPCNNFENGVAVPCIQYRPIKVRSLQLTLSIDGTFQNTNSDVSESGGFGNLIVNVPLSHYDPRTVAALPKPGLFARAKNRHYINEKLVTIQFLVQQEPRRVLVRDCPYLPDTSVQVDLTCERLWGTVMVPVKYLLIQNR